MGDIKKWQKNIKRNYWNWSDYGYDTHWIQPTWFGDGGLKQEHVDKAIRILGEINYENSKNSICKE